MDVTLGISGIVILVVMILLACVMWKVAKMLLIPIQILLFLVLMIIAYKLLFSPENMDKISDQNIQVLVHKASDSASRFVKYTAAQAAGASKAADNAQPGTASADQTAAVPAAAGENAPAPKEAVPPAPEKTGSAQP